MRLEGFVGAVKTFLRSLGFLGRSARENGLGSLSDKRRAQRLPITMPVSVYGYIDDEPFSEQTESVNVSARGGLVAISANVSCWQKIILTNLQTDEDLECRIVRLLRSGTGQILAGLEFPDVSPRFWRTGAAALTQ
jgi:hypothetical protein